MKAIIIGGGIGGLTAAIALITRAGREVEVFEALAPSLPRSARASRSGATPWRPSTGSASWGRSCALGVSGQAGAFRTPEGDVLLEMHAGPRGTAPEGVILLLHLAELLGSCSMRPGTTRWRVGAQFVGLEQDAAGVTARFADGRAAAGRPAGRGRRAPLGRPRDLVRPRSAPVRRLHGLAGRDPLRPRSAHTRRDMGPGPAVRPVGDGRGASLLVCDADGARGPGATRRGRKRGLLDLFRGWHEPIEALIGATDEVGDPPQRCLRPPAAAGLVGGPGDACWGTRPTR